MKKEFYVVNRSNSLNRIKDNSIVILFAGNAPKKTADEKYPFTPNRNFYYLTGVNEENHILLMSKMNGEIKTRLFINEVDPIREKWEGKRLREKEALDISGVDNIDYLCNFNSFINKLISSVEDLNIYLDLEKNSYEGKETLSENFAKDIKNKYPQVCFKNIFKIIGELRLVKTKEEVEEIKKAIDITIDGVELLMKKSEVGMKECELEAYFDFLCKSRGVKDFAFKTIAAAGKNATILHYVDNNSEMKNGDLILFDLGAQFNYYNGDISRTFPINGKFTDRQKDVYNAVLRVNEKVIKAMKPGINFLELNKQAKEWIAKECISLGLITNKEDVSKYYYHSIGHSLGMDTHDTDMPNRDTNFVAGMIYTVEPGIYIEEEGIGIRIEDDILITEDGRENLTVKMIKTVDEIEKFMLKK
ncbi:aminopeptidase P family protein [Clostridium gasigenes]|uniref:aminopeptidase P family protein n=1 Tax=Clostridium gasigenes TaxID=94869 RepID=UPI00143869E1|nr:aminopeptidase P family protein [Clostridium gasigenes]MBU3134139.1 aminopeptidase P family protein [Clostridium gasigenes]NKF07993.1 aminopeptidase P family protein [Clostridium gasigenes]QSW20630.1 aminopeptidase P family protein [Clostridium gasigenes]